MQTSFLIKGGTVVDGTGAPAFAGDVRVRGGFVAEIGKDLPRHDRERVVDAAGCYVTPGFIETHNHFDGPMWWMPTMEPMPGYGVTTSINGNCGFTAAPVHDDPVVREEMVKIFSFFEDIPEKPFLNQLPWDWRTWSEYKRSLRANVKLPVNFAAYVGHIAIRLAVMGLEAWDRAATTDEIAQMAASLDDALAAGALGMSSNLLDNDSRDRPIPTKRADDAEWEALLDVLARYPGRQLQVNVDWFMRMDAEQAMAKIERVAKGRGVRIQITGAIPSLGYQKPFIEKATALHERRKADGLDMWSAWHHVAPTVMINFVNSLSFAQSNNYVWHDIIKAQTEEEKLALLSDPDWLGRARDSWDKINPLSRAKNPETYMLFESETGAGPTGITLSDYMGRTGVNHPSDALAAWIRDNGVLSVLRLKDIPNDEETIDYLFADPMTVGNIADSGAHGKMFCGIGDNVLLLTRYVRDSSRLTIEQGVHQLTGRIAGHLQLTDRGTLAVGKRADIVVFRLDEIDRRPEFKTFDVPDGEGGRTYRYSRPPAPVRLTLVNGVATFDQGSFTGNFPGEHIVPLTGGDLPLAQAAE